MKYQICDHCGSVHQPQVYDATCEQCGQGTMLPVVVIAGDQIDALKDVLASTHALYELIRTWLARDTNSVMGTKTLKARANHADKCEAALAELRELVGE